MLVSRYWNLNWKSESHVLIVGCMCELCHWLHVAASICLFFKGLEKSPVWHLSAQPVIPPLLVVGYNLKNMVSLQVYHHVFPKYRFCLGWPPLLHYATIYLVTFFCKLLNPIVTVIVFICLRNLLHLQSVHFWCINNPPSSACRPQNSEKIYCRLCMGHLWWRGS